MEHGVGVVDRHHVLGRDLVERDALPLDPDLPVGAARAHVAEGQVGVALEREDPAGPRDLLAEALRHCDHQRRSVGGYSGCGKPNTMTTAESPVFAAACQVVAGVWSA